MAVGNDLGGGLEMECIRGDLSGEMMCPIQNKREMCAMKRGIHIS